MAQRLRQGLGALLDPRGSIAQVEIYITRKEQERLASEVDQQYPCGLHALLTLAVHTDHC